MTKTATKKKSKGKAIIRVEKTRHMVITPIVRLSFPNLFVAKSFQDDPKQKKEFRCDLIAKNRDVWKEPYVGEKTQTISLRQAILNCKLDQFGPKEDWPDFPYKEIHKGSERTNSDDGILEGYEGASYITPRSGEDYPPKIILAKNGKEAAEKDIYGGIWVRAQILCRPYDTGRNQGVSLRLLSIMKVKDGEKFGVGTDLFDISESDDDDEWSGEEDDDDDEI